MQTQLERQTMNDIKQKELVFIDYIKNIINDNSWKVKAEYSTNDNDTKVIVVQEQTGNKIVFYDDITPLYNYYMITIYGTSIQEEKEMSLLLQQLIGHNDLIEKDNHTWQILIKQFTNFQPIEYLDIRRVGYNATMQCIVNKIN